MAALKRPCATFSEPFMKNDTVIGTIGNTHGVRSMANPQRMASRMRAQMFLPEWDFSTSLVVDSVA